MSNKKLYVGNLSYTLSNDDLAQIFGQVGTVESARIIEDRDSGRSKGFGFVEMSDEDATKAISELDGHEIDGRAIRVSEARPQEPRRGGGGGGGGRGGRGGYGGGGGRGGYGGGGGRGGRGGGNRY